MGRVLQRLVLLSISLSVAVSLLGARQSNDVPPDVLRVQSDLRTAFEARLGIRGMALEYGAASWIGKVLRSSPQAARSWQLLPSFASELDDEAILEFVLARAEHVAVCTAIFWNYVSLSTGDAEPDELRTFVGQVTVPPNEGSAFGYNLRGCIELADLDGNTVMIGDTTEMQDVLLYERAFTDLVVPRFGAAELTRNSRYIENRDFVESEFSASIREDRGFAGRLRRAAENWPESGRVYRFSMSNLMFYVATEIEDRTQVVFLAPFSW